MRTILTILQHKMTFLTAFAWGVFEIVAVPKPMLLLLLVAAMLVDLMTGLLKSWSKGEATSSSGFRKTISKVGVYVGMILGVWVLANVLSQMYKGKAIDYAILVNGSIGFLTFIELYSIFENIYEIAPDSLLSRKLAYPILKFLKGKLDKENPIDNFKTPTDEPKG